MSPWMLHGLLPAEGLPLQGHKLIVLVQLQLSGLQCKVAGHGWQVAANTVFSKATYVQESGTYI